MSAALVELNDVFATLAAVTGAALPADAAEDSISFLPTLLGRSGAESSARAFTVHHSLRGLFALRDGPWKFVPDRGSGGFSNPKTVTVGAGQPTGQLYNLQTDPQETQNVWAQNPEVVQRLSKRLVQIRAGTGTRSSAQ